MSGFKVTNFKGTAPKISPELLPDSYAQTARNCKLYSGDLIPYPEPVVDGATGQSSTTRTIFPLRNPSTDDIVWLSWTGDVDVATPSFPTSVLEQRFYYTGDGVPKVSTYALATAGGPPYPYDYYELGLPLPEARLTTAATAYAARTITSIARDASGMVTFVTSSPHGLKNGAVVSIKGFTHFLATYSRSGQTNTITLNNHGIANGSTVFLNRTSGNMTDGSYVTAAAATNTFTVTDPESGSTSGSVKIDTRGYNTLGAQITVVNDYSFKCYLPGFEQAPYAATGGTVELGGEESVRTYVYTWYTYWGEESIASDPSEDLLVREGQLVTVTNIPTSKPTDPAKNYVGGVRLYRSFAGFQRGDYYLVATLWFPQKTATVSRTGNVSTVKMREPHNFLERDRFKLAGCTASSFNITDGTVTEVVDAYTFKYAQAGSDVATTADTTGTLYHDIAEDPLQDDAVYWGDGSFDVADQYRSLGLTIALTSDEYDPPPENLKGLKVIQNNIVAGFVDNRLFISEPGKPHAWPEANEKTIDANIVAIEPVSGIGAIVLTEKYPYILQGNDPRLMTLSPVDALYPCVSARGVVRMSYGVVYPTHEGLALYSPSAGPRLVTAQVYEQDTWNNSLDPSSIVAEYYGDSYFASHSTGSFIFRTDGQGGFFVDCDQTFTAAYNDELTNVLYFVQDASGDVYKWDDLTQPSQTMEWKSKVVLTKDYNNLGAARIIADYGVSGDLVFKVWADKTLIYNQTITDDEIFRLPSGYRSDTYEFSITGDIRVRSVHMGPTPLSLKEV